MTAKGKHDAAKRRLERVRDAFRPDDLIRICSQADFSDYAHRIDLPSWRMASGREVPSYFYYRDNGSPILAVAHLDHVQADGTCRVVDTLSGPLALSGALDDRLGAYVILELLPRLGITVDWLLTTNEEMGASTARDFFVEHKSYNWMIEFDRGGTDVVMYQYESDEMRDLLRDVGARLGMGSYSDIADLGHLGCVGFNWGVGYEDYHSKRSHAWLEDTFSMVSKFLRFYAANAATHLPFDGSGQLSPDAECPRCSSELDRWGCCWGCGYGMAELEGG
jgi:hypothetical protein